MMTDDVVSLASLELLVQTVPYNLASQFPVSVTDGVFQSLKGSCAGSRPSIVLVLAC